MFIYNWSHFVLALTAPNERSPWPSGCHWRTTPGCRRTTAASWLESLLCLDRSKSSMGSLVLVVRLFPPLGFLPRARPVGSNHDVISDRLKHFKILVNRRLAVWDINEKLKKFWNYKNWTQTKLCIKHISLGLLSVKHVSLLTSRGRQRSQILK